MTSKLIDGKRLSQTIKHQVKKQIDEYICNNLATPKLSVILIGDDPASTIYVRNKEKACAEVGIISDTYKLSADVQMTEVLDLIYRLNEDNLVNGILLQLPIPQTLDKNILINAIDPNKDVDGLCFVNQGKLVCGDTTGIFPCTPLGILELIQSKIKDLSGKVAAIIGRSLLVGKPIRTLLEQHNCTTIALHSKSQDIEMWTSQADILIAAAGVPHMVKKHWIKDGAIVIDVGIHRTSSGKIIGDVDFEDVLDVAGAITPVPGGVGPMTIAMLLYNCLKAYKIMYNRK